MKKWISFDKDIRDKDEKIIYIAHVKYKISKEDFAYYYVGDIKIEKRNGGFKVGEIICQSITHH